MHERILVVDDDPHMARAMEQVLTRGGYAVTRVASGEQALDALARRDHDAVVTDLRMPGMTGDALVARVRAMAPDTGVIVVTAYGTVESAVSCVRDGAVDYLTKPFSPDGLLHAVERALDGGDHGGDDAGGGNDGIVAVDPETLRIVELTQRAAASDATVLFEAESGAGKEVFARMLHRESARRKGPFVAVNCAALPRELLEAELFGHAKGAFTGAVRDRKGHFVTADGGTLFLDEVGEMGSELQARLLRVLQDRVVQPVGSDVPIAVDVRVVAATHRNLRNEVAQGRFREDLYYRLRVLPVRIPPLRERVRDVLPLAERFVVAFGGEVERLTPAARARLRDHSWPGNVRELQNAVQRAVILAAGGPIREDHLELEPGFGPAPGRALPESAAAPLSLEEAERDTVRRVLERTGGNRSRAAEALGISPRTLRHKLKQWRDAGRPVSVAS